MALMRLLILGVAVVMATTACFDQGRAFEESLGKLMEAGGARPYLADSPYADDLAPCMAIQSASSSCRFSRLPPLGYPEGDAPSVEEIMERLLVSHDWMGERFETIVRQMPDDARYLFRSVTAITIAADIRPAYYSSWRGAIFLDPDYLWLTAEEREDIDLSPDFRSDFGSELQFVHGWRYVIDNDYAFRLAPVSADEVETRELSDIFLPLARLLYHELAHAVDFLEPGRIAGIGRSSRIAHVTMPTVSASLTEFSPLSSAIMHALAAVRYQGENATAEQKAYTADEVSAFFGPDVAAHWYSYTTVREDQAMLFEALMSKYHFDMAMDVAFLPMNDDLAQQEDPVIAWGQRNRIADPMIRERGRRILELMLPEHDFQDWLNALEGPVELIPGEGWNANLDPESLDPESDSPPFWMQSPHPAEQGR